MKEMRGAAFSALSVLSALALAIAACLSWTAPAQGPNFGKLAPDAPERVMYHVIPHVKHAVTDSSSDTGTVSGNSNPAVTSGTLSLDDSKQPVWPRELFITQNDHDNDDVLRIKYVVTFIDAVTGSTRAITVTLVGDVDFALPWPVSRLVSIVVTTEASEASDSFDIGYRAWYLPGSFPESNSDIIFEAHGTLGGSGDIASRATAGTVPSIPGTNGGSAYKNKGFYLPDVSAIAAGDAIVVGIRTTSKAPYFLDQAPSSTYSRDLGVINQ